MRTGPAYARVAALGIALTTVALALAAPFHARAQGTPRVVEITAKRFEFTPKAGRKYALRVESPAGIAAPYALPEVRPDGVVLRAPKGVVGAGEPVPLTVRSTRDRSLMVGAYCRGRLLDSVRLKKGQTEAVLKPSRGAGDDERRPAIAAAHLFSGKFFLHEVTPPAAPA